VESAATVSAPSDTPFTAETVEMPPLENPHRGDRLTALGHSMLMQMLARVVWASSRTDCAKRMKTIHTVISNLSRWKNMLRDSKWLFEGRGRAIQDCRPTAGRLPPGLACRVILSERDLDEVLDSQGAHAGAPQSTPRRDAGTPEDAERRVCAHAGRVKAMLTRRPLTQLLVIEHGNAISDPLLTAEKLNAFLGGGLDVARWRLRSTSLCVGTAWAFPFRAAV